MIKVRTIEVSGLASALTALRLPHNGTPKSGITRTSEITPNDYDDTEYSHLSVENTIINLHKKDLSLLQNLIKSGDHHAKVMRGVLAYAEVSCSRSIWQELDTYMVGVTPLCSTSTMHTINRGVTIHDFAVNDTIKQALTPNEHEWEHYELHFDTPEKLECRIINKYGRDYEVWNNGEIYACEFVSEEKMPSGVIRKRQLPRTKLKVGGTCSKQGYYQVGIGGKKGKIYMLHRLIAEVWCDNPNGYKIVNHKDGNKGNNTPSNLEWCTSSQNNKHAFDTGLKKVGIRQKYLAFKNSKTYDDDQINAWQILQADGYTLDQISKHCGVSVSTLQRYIGGGDYEYGCEYRNDFEAALALENTIEQVNKLGMLYNETKDTSLLYDIKSILPDSFIQTRVRAFSYQALRRIVHQRHNHRLPEWREFIEWIRTLPLAEELIFHGINYNNGDPDLPK